MEAWGKKATRLDGKLMTVLSLAAKRPGLLDRAGEVVLGFRRKLLMSLRSRRSVCLLCRRCEKAFL